MASSSSTSTSDESAPSSSVAPGSSRFGGEPPPSLDPADLPPPPQSTEVRRNLGAGKGSRLRRWLVRIGILLVIAGIVAGVVYWRQRAAAEPKQEYVTKPVKRGDLQASVTATGNLQGRDTVEVGAEISGTVNAVHVDINDEVKEGQLLCEIDPQQLAASRNQTQAQLVASQASYENAKATAKEAALTAERKKQLYQEGLISQQELEAALAAADRAKASARASAAQITVGRASLESAQTKLDKTKIIAPIDGIVLGRSVEVGQTVAASLQAPLLFTLARSLKEMELTVAIDEADIGQVVQGQEATFTVDAFPDRTFQATLKQVHNIGKLVDNVVTYEALLAVKNDDLKLRPGMTAVATIVTASRKNALLVPNAALRFKPAAKEGEGGPRGPGMPGIRVRGMGRGGRPRGTASPSASASAGRPGGKGPRTAVWILVDGEPSRVRVKTGLSDGQFTEIVKGELEEGAEVITDVKQLEE
ncbi:MAG: efflux RND transporter periplasmic adaptor subunit [Deltaproteobacteria bacterium]|jgi:HlyD family secretion protein|nr:efflux RND transporter periplasmic adaptor subunit [Deltaproteobacteria bacterium]MBW2533017.1 efflux RND transporter periplasmic adaptor subunit [Deltaproteobacteria bacterium]